MTNLYKSNPIELDPKKDIIHDPDIYFFNHKDEPSYVIEDFITEDERIFLYEFFNHEYEISGENINNKVLHLIHPITYAVIRDIFEHKLKQEFGNDIVFYSDVSNDPISVGDQFFKIISPYQLHTDCVTHIPGYKPYKDIIIPIALDKSEEDTYYFTCNQRYKSRAAQFNYGFNHKYFPNYSNIYREKPYEEYGVENVEYGKMDMDFIRKYNSETTPDSVFNGISIEKIFKWIPRNAIVQDSCVIHSSTDFRKKGISWKIGLTFHLLKRDDSYGKEIIGNYYTKFSRYTQPLVSLDCMY
jgi:hypothetical protein